jgi:hypothetical protein
MYGARRFKRFALPGQGTVQGHVTFWRGQLHFDRLDVLAAHNAHGRQHIPDEQGQGGHQHDDCHCQSPVGFGHAAIIPDPALSLQKHSIG